MPRQKKIKKPAAVRKPRAPRKKKQPVAVPLQPVARPEATAPVIQKFEATRPFEFPAGYGDSRIVAMVRDPYWIFAYWEVSRAEWLRIYDTDSWQFFDIEITGGANRWYIKVPVCNRSYCVEVGYKTADGSFVALARSNWVTTPLDRMSEVIDEQWLIPDWERLYSLSGGLGFGRSSGGFRAAGSGWVSSISSPTRQPGERPFWLVANCELIVYGATEATATLTVQGRKIDLREDGSFSLRFALPDGNQVIPIEAIKDDGSQRRKITPRVTRETE